MLGGLPPGLAMRILLIDDHKATREEIRALIEREADMRVVAEAGTGEAGVDQALAQHPDIVVMDILLPGMNGIEATRRILAEQPGIRVLALSNHSGESLEQAILDAGGMGYVRKSNAFEELVPALRLVHAGQKCVGTWSPDRRS